MRGLVTETAEGGGWSAALLPFALSFEAELRQFDAGSLMRIVVPFPISLSISIFP